jgi:hypothetical protein
MKQINILLISSFKLVILVLTLIFQIIIKFIHDKVNFLSTMMNLFLI